MEEQSSGAANRPPFPSGEGDPTLGRSETPHSGPTAGDLGEEGEARREAPGFGTGSDALGSDEGEGDLGRTARRLMDSARTDAWRFAGEASEEVRRRAERGANRGLDRAAERLDEAAERLERLVESRLQGARAGEVVHSAAELLENTADYLRSSDLRSLQSDLERHVRDRPLQSMLLAVGAGWMIGKIMK